MVLIFAIMISGKGGKKEQIFPGDWACTGSSIAGVSIVKRRDFTKSLKQNKEKQGEFIAQNEFKISDKQIWLALINNK